MIKREQFREIEVSGDMLRLEFEVDGRPLYLTTKYVGELKECHIEGVVDVVVRTYNEMLPGAAPFRMVCNEYAAMQRFTL